MMIVVVLEDLEAVIPAAAAQAAIGNDPFCHSFCHSVGTFCVALCVSAVQKVPTE
jgi:hypothetical protein